MKNLIWLTALGVACDGGAELVPDSGSTGADASSGDDGGVRDGAGGHDAVVRFDGGAPGALYGYCDSIDDQPGGAWNSCEPGCDGSNPGYLHCDDFDDGQWAALDGDGYFQGERVYIGDPFAHPDNDGWSLSIYVPAEHQFGAAYGPNPAETMGSAYGRCGGAGVGRSECAVTSTFNDGTTKMMGYHRFPDDRCYDELYIRYYVKPLEGYVHGHEKSWVSIQDERRDGIWTGNFHHPFGSDELAWQPAGDVDVWRYQNMGEHTPLADGQWNFVEIHYRLNTPGVADGVIEMWVDQCGADGMACAGAPSLKMRHEDVMMRRAGDEGLICSLWYENWSNEPSSGEKYYDQLVVATEGPIGFCTSCTAP